MKWKKTEMRLYSFPEHQPRDDAFPSLVGVFHWITDVMTEAIFTAIIHIVGTASDVDGVKESVFAEGIGKVPYPSTIYLSKFSKFIFYLFYLFVSLIYRIFAAKK